MRRLIQCVYNDNQNVTPLDTIYAIKKAGFDGVFLQWYNKDWEISQEKQLELCRKLELDVPFVHLGFDGINNIWIDGEDGDKLVEKYLRDLDVCANIDVRMIVLHITSKFLAPEPSLVGVKRIQKIVDYAKKLEIKVAFENMKIKGYLEYLFEFLKGDNAGICFDSGHYHCYFGNQFSWRKFENRIFAVHLHDNFSIIDSHMLPFDGSIDWKILLKDLKEANYTGDIILESCYRNEYLEKSLEDFYKLSYNRAKEIELFLQ